MRINPLFLSPSLAGQLKTVLFLLSEDNSNASPLETFKRSAIDGSIRAIFLPTSRCSATSAILRFAVLVDLPSLAIFLLFSLSSSTFDDILCSCHSKVSYLKVRQTDSLFHYYLEYVGFSRYHSMSLGMNVYVSFRKK